MVFVQGTVVFVKRHFQFVHFVRNKQAVDDMTGVIDCVWFCGEEMKTVEIGEMVSFRGKLRVYNEAVQVNVRSGIRRSYTDRIKTKDEELYLLSRTLSLFTPPTPPPLIPIKRSFRSVKPIQILDSLRSLRLIEVLQSFPSPCISYSSLLSQCSHFLNPDQLRHSLSHLATMGLIDLQDSSSDTTVLLGKAPIHPRDQVLDIIKSNYNDFQGVSIFTIMEELGRRNADMGVLAPMMVGELVEKGVIYEVEGRRFREVKVGN